MDTFSHAEILEACENFLSDWDRREWVIEHGEWASSEWDNERGAYDIAVAKFAAAVETLDEELGNVPESHDYDGGDLANARDSMANLNAAFRALESAATSLEGQIKPDESDYTSEGLIDPDGVANRADDLECGIWGDGWDCREGWSAYRVDDALYIRWWRDAWGNRHERDLWVLVDDRFFPND